MILYQDTSALVKAYVEEAYSDMVEEVMGRARVIVTHQITYPECCSALARAHRDKRLTDEQWAEARKDFEADWENYLRLPVTPALLKRAAVLAEAFYLRGYDSVQLAAAESARNQCLESDEEFEFATFDRELKRAGKALDWKLVTLPD